MKRKLLDLGLTAGAAALLLLVLQSTWVRAAFITFPKSWVVGEILTSGDLNAQFASITAQVNGNLDDTNISGAAAINGSKLADAPNGITTTKINDLAVTGGKLANGAVTAGKIAPLAVTTGNLAVGATLNTEVSAQPTAGSYFGAANSTFLTLPSATTRGGPVLFSTTVGGDLLFTASGTDIALFTLFRDGVSIQTFDVVGGSAAGATVAIPTITWLDFAPAGAHVYTVAVAFVGVGNAGQLLVKSGQPGFAFAAELS
jgi:hypothetical protein